MGKKSNCNPFLSYTIEQILQIFNTEIPSSDSAFRQTWSQDTGKNLIFGNSGEHKDTKPSASINKPPPLLNNSTSNKISHWRHHGSKTLQTKIFFFDRVIIYYSKRCFLVVELLSGSYFLNNRLLCFSYLQNSTSTFILMFEKTTTKQNRKQMDILFKMFLWNSQSFREQISIVLFSQWLEPTRPGRPDFVV